MANKDLWVIRYLDPMTQGGTVISSDDVVVKVARTIAVGLLVAEDETGICLAQESFDAGEFRGLLHIPHCCVVHRQMLAALTDIWPDETHEQKGETHE